jgi:hypothetical protein
MRCVSGCGFLATRYCLVASIEPKLILGLFLTAGVGRGVAEQPAILVLLPRQGRLDSQLAVGVVLPALADLPKQPESQQFRRLILALRPGNLDRPGVLIGNRCTAGLAT